MKKIMFFLAIFVLSSQCVNAQDMNMYVKDTYVVRDMQTVNDFDMLPILDIAGELGFHCYYDGNIINLYNDTKGYVFTVGSASVYDESGNWYGLDVVPQVINGKVRVPAKFFQDAMGMSYVWDAVTNTIFMGSENTYNWLIGTWEYQEGKAVYNTRNSIQGWWFHYEPSLPHFSENIYFGNDGSYYGQTWREKYYGTYNVTSPTTIEVTYDWYFCGAGSSEFVYIGTNTAEYSLIGNVLYHNSTTFDDGDTYYSNTSYEHRYSFTDVGIQY